MFFCNSRYISLSPQTHISGITIKHAEMCCCGLRIWRENTIFWSFQDLWKLYPNLNDPIITQFMQQKNKWSSKGFNQPCDCESKTRSSFFFFKTKSYCLAQAVLETHDIPSSTFQGVGTTGVNHHTWISSFFSQCWELNSGLHSC
jgi:hypothetical protein